MRNKLASFALFAFIVCGTATLLRPAADSSETYVGFPPGSDRGEGYRVELARLERRIAAAERLVRAAPQSWMRRVDLASLLMDRGSLASRHADYLTAEREIATALELGPHAASVHLLRAQLSFTLHRFDRVEADLVLPEQEANDADDDAAIGGILAMRGSLAFERGDYEEAEALLERAIELHRGYDSLARLAHLHFKTCRLETALELMSEAEEALPRRAARARAWVQLQRGHMALERGRYDEALESYEQADATYAGWWLVDEHIAEVDNLAGRTDRAIERYERLAAEIQSPELVGALAGLLVKSNPQRAAELVERARASYAEQLRLLPEATYGHALHHFLDLEKDASQAVALAEKNRTLRPNGEARTLLARAYLKAGRIDDARAELAAIHATRWCSASTDDVAESLAEAEG